MECNFSTDQIDIPSSFYQELLISWQKIREIADPDNSCKHIIWNNKDILIDGKKCFFTEITLLRKLSMQLTCYLT